MAYVGSDASSKSGMRELEFVALVDAKGEMRGPCRSRFVHYKWDDRLQVVSYLSAKDAMIGPSR